MRVTWLTGANVTQGGRITFVLAIIILDAVG